MIEPKRLGRGVTTTVMVADPEVLIYSYMRELCKELMLESRNIDSSQMVMQGHPVYDQSLKDGELDSKFPKIGIVRFSSVDHEDIGHNHRTVLANDYFKKRLRYYADREDFKQSQPVPEAIEALLDVPSNMLIDEHQTRNESIVTVTGWCSGGTARKAAQILFDSVQGAMPVLIKEIHADLDGAIPVKVTGSPEPNHVDERFSPHLWGFEIMLAVEQIKNTYRFDSAIVDWLKQANITADLYGIIFGQLSYHRSEEETK